MGSLATLFAPDRVAVVGATDREGSVGGLVTQNLLAAFEGEVVAVNPNRESVFGLACRDSLAGTDGVNLAVVVVPPPAVVGAVREAGESGIGDVVVLTPGSRRRAAKGPPASASWRASPRSTA